MSGRSVLFGCLLFAGPAFACAALEGDSITAADLAPGNSAFAALDPQTALVPAPLAGAVRVLHVSELVSLARRHAITLQGPLEDVCFERPSEPLTLALLQSVLDQQFEQQPDQQPVGVPFEIADFSRVRIPVTADRKFEINRPQANPQSGPQSNMLRGRVTYSGGHSVAFWVRLKGAGNPQVQPTDAVERGEAVSVEVHSGAARLAFASTAESSGHSGESILVRNPQNGKLFQAKVQSKGKVLVQR